jgi:site-specific recombinase XerD
MTGTVGQAGFLLALDPSVSERFLETKVSKSRYTAYRKMSYNETMTTVEKLFGEYLDYLEIEKGRSPKTRENYERYIKEYLNFSGATTPQNITEESVRKFRLYLARRDMKKVTQSYYLIALRNFLKYLAKRDIKALAPEKIELPKIPERQIDVIEYADLERLLKAPENEPVKTANDRLRALRDKAILETLFSTGLRLAELCSLNRDIDLNRSEFTVRGKGNKLRIVFLSNTAKHALKEYLGKRGDMDPALFVNFGKAKKTGEAARVTPRTVQRIIDFWARRAGIAKRVHPHQLRHLFATDLLLNGADLRSVQVLLGHANISTTQAYTHLTNKELREIHQAFHGKRRKE